MRISFKRATEQQRKEFLADDVALTPACCGVNAGGFFITGRWATAVSCDLTTVIHTHRVPWIQTEAHLLAQARGF